MKNRRLVEPICLVTLICRALSVTVSNRESRLSVSSYLISPIAFSPPTLSCLERRFARWPRRAPSLRVASSSPIRLLGVVCHCQSSGGTCVFGACSPCLCRRRVNSRGDLAAPPRPVSVRDLPLTESVARSSSTIARGLEVPVFAALLTWYEVCCSI